METNKVETKKTETKRMEPDLKLINMETVEVEQIEWLFYPFIPFGKVTIIQGDPGEGKTTMVLQIIAKLTRGEKFFQSRNRQLMRKIEQKRTLILLRTSGKPDRACECYLSDSGGWTGRYD